MVASTHVSWRTCASSLVMLLAIAVAACGSSASGRAATTGARGSRSDAPRPASLAANWPSRVQRADFALLRTPPEGLPADVQRRVSDLGAAVVPAAAQRIPAVVPGRFWLLPGRSQLCIVSEVPGTPGVGSVCASTRQVVAHAVATISFTPAEQMAAGTPTRLVVGIAPDDAREALVHTRATVTTVPVLRGVFVLRDSRRVPSDFITLRRAHRSGR
jgi:hypothetical protein